MMVSECNVKYLQLAGVYNNYNQHSAHDAAVSRYKLEHTAKEAWSHLNYGAGH